MDDPIIPAFGPHRFPQEGAIVGRLLTGFGDLLIELAACAEAVSGDLDAEIREMYGKRGEEQRIDDARKQIRDAYDRVGLKTELFRIVSDLHWCRKIRNQYAHCQWGDD